MEQDPTKPQRPSLELTLAQQANAAIEQGADPHAATEMLGKMLTHLKQNPALAQQGTAALAQGADPHAVSGKVWQMVSAPPTPPTSTVERPGVLTRGLARVGEGLGQLITHPLDAASNLIAAPIKSAFTAVVAPAVGEARPDARLSKGGNSSGRAIDTSPYDAAHGGVTSGERTAAGIQSVVNAAAPSLFKPIARIAGNTAALATTGAAAGAAYNPDDPGAGAVSGGIMTPLIGGAIAGGTKLANTTGRVSALSKRIANATPVDQQALAQNRATEAATRANYGQAAAEGEAAGGTSAALQDAFKHPTIQPFVDMVRESPRFKNADDATVAREAYKQISKQRRGLIKRANGPNGYDAKADLQAGDLADAAHALKSATSQPGTAPIPAPETAQSPAPSTRDALQAFRDRQTAAYTRNAGTIEQQMARRALERHQSADGLPSITGARTDATVETPGVMPSFPTAVSEHARMMGNRGVFNDAVDMTRRTMSAKAIPANRLDTQSPASWLDRISQMSPEQAGFARDAALGAAQPLIRKVLPTAGALAGGATGGAIFGGGPGAALGVVGGYAASAGRTLSNNMTRLSRIAPIIEALDAATGTPTRQPIDPTRALQMTALLQAFATPPDVSDRRRNR